MRALHIVQSLLGLTLTCATAEAGMEYGWFALHRKAKFTPTKTITSVCDNPATTTEEPNYSPNYENLPCCQYTTYAPVGSSQIYIVAGHVGSGGGISAVSFGIDYTGASSSGVDPQFVTFTPCADGEAFMSNDGVHGDFPQPGGGLRISWTTCQNEVISISGVHAVVGSLYVYVYSQAQLWLTPNNNVGSAPELILSDCAGTPTNLLEYWSSIPNMELTGSVDFAGGYGRIPLWCCPDPNRAATWGKLKTRYADPD